MIEDSQNIRMSVSLNPILVNFVEKYQENHQSKSKSAVFEEALHLLRKEELKRQFRQLMLELEPSDLETLDTVSADGLNHEAW